MENSCKSINRLATIITMRPPIRKNSFAHFRPIIVNTIEPSDIAKATKEMDELLLRNSGKKEWKLSTFSACEAEGFEENVQIHNTQIERGTSNRTIPIIESALLLRGV